MKKLLVYICLFISSTFALAQEQENLLEEFERLKEQFRDNNTTSEKAKKMVTAYLQKTQISGEKKYIGRAYYLLAIKNDNYEERIQYLDSSIAYTKELKNDATFPMKAYI